MVEVKYITGDTETFEVDELNKWYPWGYKKISRTYIIPSIDGNVEIPKESILSIKYVGL